jgi:hypothetical protein
MDDAARDMQQRVRFVGREDWKDMAAGHHAIVTIKTRGGKSLEEEVWHQPMTGDELDLKFDELVTPRFGREKCAMAAKLLKALETAASVTPVLTELEGG